MQVFYYKGSIRFTQYVYFQLSLTLMATRSILLHLSLRKANKCVFLLKQLLVTNLLSKAELSSTDNKGLHSPLECSITMCMQNNDWKPFHSFKQK